MFTIKRISIAAAVVVALVIPFLGMQQYYFHLISYSLIWVIMTQGLNIIQGYTGYVSIAQAAFFGIGAYASSLLSIDLGISVWLSIPLAVVISGFAGLIVGFPALRTQGHYFAIVTMSFCMIIWVLMVSWDSFTRGEAGITNVEGPSPLFGIDFADKHNYYYLILLGVFASILISYRLVYSRTGRALITIRENEPLAQAVGIPILRYKMIAFTVSAMMGGLSGALYAHYTHFINPTPFTVDYSLNAILAVILGGSGTIVGPIIGSFIMNFLPEYLRMADEYRLIIYGVLLILIMVYMPKGIIHLLQIGYAYVRMKLNRSERG
ncbi:branched-chain amino acid ABC transporter permease [Paenibacillus chungangensis]|uniref:Branched-chain amino acid ABC transporter permease n=1 Tax=Paenibacillus chungangensis TaxID=696535 RepID=A0ABW3HQP1_9BACL